MTYRFLSPIDATYGGNLDSAVGSRWINPKLVLEFPTSCTFLRAKGIWLIIQPINWLCNISFRQKKYFEAIWLMQKKKSISTSFSGNYLYFFSGNSAMKPNSYSFHLSVRNGLYWQPFFVEQIPIDSLVKEKSTATGFLQIFFAKTISVVLSIIPLCPK